MELAQLLTHVSLGKVDPHLDVTGLAYDSRRVRPGYLFAAWAGQQADGHDFIAEAVQRGAVAILCERPVTTAAGVPCIQVAHVRKTLAQAAQRFYHDPSAHLTMVGVTGTSGKTTTVHLIEAVLEQAGLRPGIIGTLGSRFGGTSVTGALTTPDSLELLELLTQMQANGCQSIAMEASSQALDQHRVFGLRFDVGVFTNLTQDHLDYHGDAERYFAAKERLFTTHLKRYGVRVVNLDDARAERLLTPDTLSFSAQGNVSAAICLEDVKLGPQGSQIKVRTPRGLWNITTPLVGRFNIENILAAVGVGLALHFNPDAIMRGIAAMASVPGRLERVSGVGEPLVLVDYSHKPDALVKALAAVREITSGRVFCVFGCGGDRDPSKRAPMGEAAGNGAFWSILTNDNPRTEDPALIAAAVEVGLQAAGARPVADATEFGYHVELARDRAIALAIAHARADDSVLIAGKGHETYQVIGHDKLPFDDREQARAALAQRPKQEAT